MLKKDSICKGAKLTLPIFFGYISIGIPFGLMVVNNGYPWWLALFMGMTIFSGTGQYIGISLMAAGISCNTVFCRNQTCCLRTFAPKKI